MYDNGIRAAVVHHTAGSNDYAPEDSAGIVRSIYEYHTRTLGWCDIAYNALVDKYGQVFEGRAGGMDKPVEGSHTGGFNHNTWGVAMMGDFDAVPPTPIQLRTTARLIGWRLGFDHVNPRGTVVLPSAGGSFTKFPVGATPTLPTNDLQDALGLTGAQTPMQVAVQQGVTGQDEGVLEGRLLEGGALLAVRAVVDEDGSENSRRLVAALKAEKGVSLKVVDFTGQTVAALKVKKENWLRSGHVSPASGGKAWIWGHAWLRPKSGCNRRVSRIQGNKRAGAPNPRNSRRGKR